MTLPVNLPMTSRVNLLVTAAALWLYSGLTFAEPIDELDVAHGGRIGLTLDAPNPPDATPDSARPNIVFILADDLGFSDLASYGSEIKTPVLDQLAASGVRFSNFHTAANCAPSGAALSPEWP